MAVKKSIGKGQILVCYARVYFVQFSYVSVKACRLTGFGPNRGSNDGVLLGLHLDLVFVHLVGGPAGLQHEGVHPRANLPGRDAHLRGHTGAEVNTADRV